MHVMSASVVSVELGDIYRTNTMTATELLPGGTTDKLTDRTAMGIDTPPEVTTITGSQIDQTAMGIGNLTEAISGSQTGRTM